MYAAMLVPPPLSFLHEGGDFSARNAAIASVSQACRNIFIYKRSVKRNMMLWGTKLFLALLHSMFEAIEVMPYELCIILLWVSVQPPKIIQQSLAIIICSAKRADDTIRRRWLFAPLHS